MELNITLREMARESGLCDEWYGNWKDDDTIDDCLERYVRGFDFSVKNDWPSLDFCREHFSPRLELLHNHNIFLDEEVYMYAESGHYVFLGSCSGVLRVSGMKAVTVYCRHDSHVNVWSVDGARVFVSHYDTSGGNCYSDEWSRINVYDRGGRK